MELHELAEKIGAKVVMRGESVTAEINRICAGNKISELLRHASDTTLLVTNLANLAVIRAAALMDVPGICFLDGIDPEPEVVKAAMSQGTMLIVSCAGMSETCGHLNECLADGDKDGS